MAKRTPERIREDKRKWANNTYANNSEWREKVKKDSLARYHTNREKTMNQRNRQNRLDPRKPMFQGAKARAKKRVLPLTITPKDIYVPTFCPVLNIPIKICGHRNNFASPSLDRIDSSKGYIPENICVISWRANSVKNQGTEDEHKKIANYMNKFIKTNENKAE